jgi:hypothetical protein
MWTRCKIGRCHVVEERCSYVIWFCQFHKNSCYMQSATCFFGLFFSPKDGGNSSLQNVGESLPEYRESDPRRQYSFNFGVVKHFPLSVHYAVQTYHARSLNKKVCYSDSDILFPTSTQNPCILYSRQMSVSPFFSQVTYFRIKVWKQKMFLLER